MLNDEELGAAAFKDGFPARRQRLLILIWAVISRQLQTDTQIIDTPEASSRVPCREFAAGAFHLIMEQTGCGDLMYPKRAIDADGRRRN